MKQNSIIVIFLLSALMAQSQQTVPLYPRAIPNSIDGPDEESSEQRNGVTIVSKISRPTLSIFVPEKPNGTAVIIFPGGGYRINATSHEGTDVARTLNQFGVTAFVVKYRIPDDHTMKDKEIGPLQDAQQAIKTVRSRAGEWNIRPDRIGVLGFSAGGHLASTVGTHFGKSVIDNADSINLRPDFMILIYPVISFQSDIGHTGSKNQLLGPSPNSMKIDYYSNELQVTPKTPPTFLVHASDDGTVSPEHSIRFYRALRQHNIIAEMHIYQKGGHGFGMINKETEDRWMERCKNWLKANGWLP